MGTFQMTTCIYKGGIVYTDSRATYRVLDDYGNVVEKLYGKVVKCYTVGRYVIYGTGDKGLFTDFIQLLNVFRSPRLMYYLYRLYAAGYNDPDACCNIVFLNKRRPREVIAIKFKRKRAYKIPFRKEWLYFLSPTWEQYIFKSDNNHITSGSGYEYAHDALKRGLTPPEAICYAADRDPSTDDDVKTYIVSCE